MVCFQRFSLLIYKVKEAVWKDSRARFALKLDKTHTTDYNEAGGGEEVSDRAVPV